jgi:hypothetical protein
MSTDAETGATFEVRNGTGAVVFSGPIGPLLGSWSRTLPFVYFGSITAPGTYPITVPGPVPANSPAFGIDSGENVYDEAHANALSFFQTERDGLHRGPSSLGPRASERSERDDVRCASREPERAPTSFAYPFGTFDDGTKQVVRDCGYNSGRGVSGVDGTSVFAETIPPADAYATRTPPNPKQGTTLETIEGYVTGEVTHGGGWVQLVFHHLCDGCDAYSITPANFDALLDWLKGQAANNVVVRTTHEVVGGPVQPSPVPP